MRKGLVEMGRAVLVCFLALLLAVAIANGPARAQAGAQVKPEDAVQLQNGTRAFKSRKYETAFRILKPLAMRGNADAQLMVGDMYNLGAGVAQDNSAAIDWYRKSAMQGNAEAIEMLGQGMRLTGEK